jgi:hypothetical protein
MRSITNITKTRTDMYSKCAKPLRDTRSSEAKHNTSNLSMWQKHTPLIHTIIVKEKRVGDPRRGVNLLPNYSFWGKTIYRIETTCV